MSKTHACGRIALVSVAATIAATLAGGGAAHAHGSCWATAQIPAFQLTNNVGGGNTAECTYTHATLQSCVQLQWRSATSSSWTNIGTQACNSSTSSAYQYVSKTVACTTGYWRSHGTAKAWNHDGVLAHSVTHNSNERFITCA